MATNHTHHSLLKVLFAMFLFLVVASGLAAAVLMTQKPVSVDSQASVKDGIVVVNLVNTTKEAKLNVPVTVNVMINSNKAVINTASLGIRFKDSNPKSIAFTPYIKNYLTKSEVVARASGTDAGINLNFFNADNRGQVFPAGTILGQLTFTPTAPGSVIIYFDTTISQVPLFIAGAPGPTVSPRTQCGSTKDCPANFDCIQPTMAPCPAGMMCAQVMPARYCRLRETTQAQAATAARSSDTGFLPGEPVPGRVRDILQTPASLLITVLAPTPIPMSPIPTASPKCTDNAQCGTSRSCINGACVPNPSPTTIPTCTGDSQCGPIGYCSEGKCVPLCNTNSQCGSGKQCLSGHCVLLPSPTATAFPTPYPTPNPTAYPTR